jgi:hypothetical protein
MSCRPVARHGPAAVSGGRRRSDERSWIKLFLNPSAQPFVKLGSSICLL